MRWWTERRSKLWWKEVREIWPVIGLGWLVIAAMLTKLPTIKNMSDAYVWGIDFNITAIAILFFVALVLGVTAYAVEDEYETLEPLLAKPISPDDILATKLGTRLGLLFLSWIAVGAVELWAGGWPIEYRVPSPWGFERWLSGLAMLIMGLGLGFYFGKITGRQITGLMSALLVVAAGWALLLLSPIAFLFEADEARDPNWIRAILIPGIAGTAVILMSIRAGRSGRGNMTRPVVAVLTLIGYALVFWSFTVVSPRDAWKSKEAYQAHWTARFSGPERVIDVLLDRYRDEVPRRQWRLSVNNPDSLALSILGDTYLYRERIYESEREFIPRSALLVGFENTRVFQYTTEITINDFTSVENQVVEKRSPRFIERCLETVRIPSHSLHHRLIALHLAGVADDPAHTDLIASFLDDPSLYVRIMSATILTARGDPRGEETLVGMLPTLHLEPIQDADYLQRLVARKISDLALDLGPEFEAVAREWALQQDVAWDYWSRSLAQIWLRKYGTMDDADLVRQSLLLRYSGNRYSGIFEPEDIDILDYLEDWGLPEHDYREALYRQAVRYRSQVESMREEVNRIDEKRQSTLSERRFRNRYVNLRSWLESSLSEMTRRGDVRVLDLWRESRHLLRQYYSGSIPVLISLPALGEPGFTRLREIVADPAERIPVRFNAALILAYHGFREYDTEVLRYYNLYRHADDEISDFFSYGSVLNAFLVMAHEGHPGYIGPIMDEATSFYESRNNRSTRSRSFYRWGWMDSSRIIGSPLWNDRIIEILKQISGEDYGWDIMAWKKWWEREGIHMAASGSNN